MDARLLLLADSRLPAGGHAHSGGVEPAATAGAITGLAGLADFLAARLATAGLVTAGLAAAACALASPPRGPDGGEHDGGEHDDGKHDRRGPEREDGGTGDAPGWVLLDAEADARMPSPAQRAASRAQGRALLRVARTTWPHPALDAVASLVSAAPRRGAPHHPIVLGAAAAAAGGTPRQAAAIAAYGSVTGPASAAVRLLGLDPLAVQRVLAVLAPDVDAIAARVTSGSRATSGSAGWAALPAVSAPGLDLFAELHLCSEMRLFES